MESARAAYYDLFLAERSLEQTLSAVLRETARSKGNLDQPLAILRQTSLRGSALRAGLVRSMRFSFCS